MIDGDGASTLGSAAVATSVDAQHSGKKRSMVGYVTGKVVVYILMTFLAVLSIFPFLWMLSTSLKQQNRVMTSKIELIPKAFAWENYEKVLTNPDVPFDLFFLNTAKVTIIVVVLRIIACSLAGYAFARLEFPFKDALFAMLLASMLIPTAVKIIPLFEIYKQLGWLDTHLSIIVEPAFANTFGTFLMRQFFMTIPRELEDAARVDGESPAGVFWRIALPLAKPALAVIVIFTFTATWNSFLEPLVYLQSVDKLTIQPGLSFYGSGGASTSFSPSAYNLIMAGGILSLIPVFVIYLIFQRYFTEGIALSGIKG
jgi:multiple sugar transport system permease protein